MYNQRLTQTPDRGLDRGLNEVLCMLPTRLPPAGILLALGACSLGRPLATDGPATEGLSIRVAGFVEAAGIT